MRFGTWWTSCLPELRERLNGGQHLIDGDKDLAKTKAFSHEIACSTRPNSGWPQPVTISSCSTIPSKPGTTWANRRSISMAIPMGYLKPFARQYEVASAYELLPVADSDR